MTLTPTKAHDQFMPALSEMANSLKRYGHSDVELVYTDNVRADKPELERVFPSLLRNVSPVPTTTKPLVIPDNWRENIHLLTSTYQVNNFFNIVMEDLANIPTDATLSFPFDMEWSVDRSLGIQGRVALLQLIYANHIYLIPVSLILLSLSLHADLNYISSAHTLIVKDICAICLMHCFHSFELHAF